jgi:hypothetical protein
MNRYLCLSLFLCLSACGSHEEGTRLNLWLSHRSADGVQVDTEGRHFTTEAGEHITLSRAFITLSSVELLPCPTAATRLQHVLGWLSPIGTASAHSAHSPLRLGEPHVSSLSRPEGEPLSLGTLNPPPGPWCQARLVFGPADADAEGLSDEPRMVGRSLLLEGEVSQGNEPPRTFRLESRAAVTVDVPLESLTLSEDMPVTSTFVLALDRWWEGVDMNSEIFGADRALRNLSASITVDAVR